LSSSSSLEVSREAASVPVRAFAFSAVPGSIPFQHSLR
jgi:hypothetical protein